MKKIEEESREESDEEGEEEYEPIVSKRKYTNLIKFITRIH